MKMPDLEVNIFNQKIKLSYQENEKKRLKKVIETLNKIWIKFSNLHGKVSDIKIIILICIELQDSIEDIKNLKEKINSQVVEIQSKVNSLEESQDTIKNLNLELSDKNNEILAIENLIDEIQNDLLMIKSKMVKKHE